MDHPRSSTTSIALCYPSHLPKRRIESLNVEVDPMRAVSRRLTFERCWFLLARGLRGVPGVTEQQTTLSSGVEVEFGGKLVLALLSLRLPTLALYNYHYRMPKSSKHKKERKADFTVRFSSPPVSRDGRT
jgi:hypothetical protein